MQGSSFRSRAWRNSYPPPRRGARPTGAPRRFAHARSDTSVLRIAAAAQRRPACFYLLLPDAGTSALPERTEHLVARQRVDDLDEIPLALPFSRRLDLHEEDVVHHAAI